MTVISCLSTSKLCATQDTSTQETGAPDTSRNMASLSRSSMSRQYSLRSQHSSQVNRRSPAPPEAAPQHSSRALTKPAEDTAPRASDGVPSKEENRKFGQEGGPASSQHANFGGQGVPLSQVPQSPFEQWRAGGDSTHRDQPQVAASGSS